MILDDTVSVLSEVVKRYRICEWFDSVKDVCYNAKGPANKLTLVQYLDGTTHVELS